MVSPNSDLPGGKSTIAQPCGFNFLDKVSTNLRTRLDQYYKSDRGKMSLKKPCFEPQYPP